MIKLESIQKQVKKQYPEAMLSVSPLGQYFIEWNDQNLNDIFLLWYLSANDTILVAISSVS